MALECAYIQLVFFFCKLYICYIDEERCLVLKKCSGDTVDVSYDYIYMYVVMAIRSVLY